MPSLKVHAVFSGGIIPLCCFICGHCYATMPAFASFTNLAMERNLRLKKFAEKIRKPIG